MSQVLLCGHASTRLIEGGSIHFDADGKRVDEYMRRHVCKICEISWADGQSPPEVVLGYIEDAAR